MLWQRLLFGSLMIVGLAGLIVGDAWLSASGRAVSSAPAPGGSASSAPGGAPTSQPEPLPMGQALRSGLLITLLFAVIAVAAILELARLCDSGGYQPLTRWAIVIGVALILTPWLQMVQRISGRELPGVLQADQFSLFTFVLTVGFMGSCFGMLLRKTTFQAVSTMAVTMFLILYIGLLASFAVRIRCLSPGAAGSAVLVYFILTVKCSDIGAYFTGIAIGKHKLVPWLSPGKTYEGAAGAIVGSIVAAQAGMVIWDLMASSLGPPPLSSPQALVFGLLMAVLGHVGDLVESAVKRNVGAKDSAHVVPAFGGLLDILDSPLFAAPVGWWLLTFARQMG